MQNQAEVAALITEYAGVHRAIRIARGYNDFNLDVVVAYACEDLLNQYKRHNDASALEILRDEVAYEHECLAKIVAGAQ